MYLTGRTAGACRLRNISCRLPIYFVETEMHWRKLILPGVLAASCFMNACRETTPAAPTPLAEHGQSGNISSPPASAPPISPAPPVTSGSCDGAKAQWAVGHAASDELLERARVSAGADSARFLRPNQPVTLEFLGGRLNLGLDARDVVRSVVCG